jgi:hypothetical protein
MITVKELLAGMKEQEIPEGALCYGYDGTL